MIEVLDNIEALAEVENDWNRLAEHMNAPLLRHEWFMAAAAAFHAEALLQIVIVRGPTGQIIAAAPLVVSRRLGVPRLELIGCTRLYEPSGYLFEDAASLQVLRTAVIHLGRPVVLGRVPAALSHALRPQVRRIGPRAVIWSRRVSGAPYICLGMERGQYLSSQPSRRRTNLHRRRQLADEIGGVEMTIVKPTQEQLPQLLNELVEVESAGWKGARGSAIGSNLEMKAFIFNFARAACNAGILRIGLLTIAGRAAAALMGIESGGAFWQLKLGYDERFSRCSPGVLLMHEAVKYACDSGLDSFEILGVEEPWKRLWTRDLHPMESVMCYPLSFVGGVAFFVDVSLRAAGAARRVYRTYRPVARETIFGRQTSSAG